MMDCPSGFVVVLEVILARKQPERSRLYNCAPQARLKAERTVAFGGALTQINVGLVANSTAVAASGVGLQHRRSPLSRFGV